MSLRVGLVSTYAPQRCGIAAYTQDLARALGDAGVEPVVLAERPAARGVEDGIAVQPAFHRSDRAWPEAIATAARAARVDLVHVQYGTDVFGVDGRLPRLSTLLGGHGVPTVVTLHTVLPRATAAAILRWNAGRFYRTLARTARIVVHQHAGQRDVLAGWGVPEAGVTVIPLGTRAPATLDRAAARARHGLPATGPLLLVLGFIHPLKNVHVAVRAVARLRDRHPALRLLIAGTVRGASRIDHAYARWLRREIDRHALGERLGFREEFVPDGELAELCAAADLLLLPYWEPYGSASGVVHLGLAAATPMLCSPSPKFAEVGAAVGPEAIVPTHRARDWAERIATWITDEAWLDEVRRRLVRHAEATRWAAVARKTAAFYQAVVRGRPA